VAPRRARAIQWLSNTVLRATTKSCSSTIGHISLDRKQAGKPSARNGHARFDVAGSENQLTIRLMRHSQRKRGATDRSNLRSLASVLDPTDRGDGGNVGIIRSRYAPLSHPTAGDDQRWSSLPRQLTHYRILRWPGAKHSSKARMK